MSTIAQVANFVAPHSGGIRTVLEQLAHGYAEAGHEVVQVVPGDSARVSDKSWGRRVTLPGRSLPRTGYRVLGRTRVERALADIRPDRLEVHDRTTLRGLGQWARTHDVHSIVVSHERLDRWLAQWTPGFVPHSSVADRANARLAAAFDVVVCTTRWAAEEFVRYPGVVLRQVPLGVDLDVFSPALFDAGMRATFASTDENLLIMSTRLSHEKHPGLAIEAVSTLLARGVPVRLVVAGEGPLRGRLRTLAAGLPVRFAGFIPERRDLARLYASADIALAPGPIETFCLSALEALASGTPVVANRSAASASVIGGAGVAVAGTAAAFADGVEQLLSLPVDSRRATARARAEQFRWSRTVEGFLAAHALAPRALVA